MSNDNQKYVIFDLDGTLIDSFECVLRCVNKALASYGLPSVMLPKSSSRKDIELIFNRAKKILQDKVAWDDFKDLFDSIHLNDCIEDIVINPIANNLLREYYDKGYAIVIVTNKLDKITEKICNTLFPDYNILIIGRKSVSSIKSNWDYIAKRIYYLGFSLGSCLCYIGDTETDLRLSGQLSVRFYNINDLSDIKHIKDT